MAGSGVSILIFSSFYSNDLLSFNSPTSFASKCITTQNKTSNETNFIEYPARLVLLAVCSTMEGQEGYMVVDAGKLDTSDDDRLCRPS